MKPDTVAASYQQESTGMGAEKYAATLAYSASSLGLPVVPDQIGGQQCHSSPSIARFGKARLENQSDLNTVRIPFYEVFKELLSIIKVA
ncbi:MAG: hypothetical protein FRX49_12024 [Trebouxia sp. A1-2]|nr:MAG: hypothetical protein FRX49_12024 [Trebouxia sp. A1-2]